MTADPAVALIGLGPRGLTVLERILSRCLVLGPVAGRLRIEVIDPTCTGTGVHDMQLPDYLLLNSSCGEISLFPHHSVAGSAVSCGGPTFYEWARKAGLDEHGRRSAGPGRTVATTDYLPRRVLGAYLRYCLVKLLARTPSYVQVTLHRTHADDVWVEPSGRFTILGRDGLRTTADYLVITTGHTADEPPPAAPGSHRRIGLQPERGPRTQAIGRAQTVAVSGLGLSAYDVVASLTVGRGGHFQRGPDGLRYVPNGQEPTIVMFSRSGIPYRAKPRGRAGSTPDTYPARFLTPAALAGLRQVHGRALDFQQLVLPLLFDEMRLAYRIRATELAGDKPAAEILRSSTDPEALRALLARIDAAHGGFDARAVFEREPGLGLERSDTYQHWLTNALALDLAEADRGTAASPLKAALQVCDERLPVIRAAIDHGGLTQASLATFFSRTTNQLNRAVVGPQYERQAEFLALFAAGVVRTPFGPAPQVSWSDPDQRWVVRSTRLAAPVTGQADWLVDAMTPPPSVLRSTSRLLRNLHARGLIRPFPGLGAIPGVEVDADQHPVDTRGRPVQEMWVFGPLCEGNTYYNHEVPSAGDYSRPHTDADRCVDAILGAAARVSG